MQADHKRYRVKAGKFKLSSVNPADNQGLGDTKAARSAGAKLLKSNVKKISRLQERLYAESKRGLLVVFQAMDAGGKDSTTRAVTKGVNPQGCVVSSFKAPSKEELAHDFLWRVHDKTPGKGTIRIFNRSHYEDVLIVRVNDWAPKELTEKRYGHINDFERLLVDNGTNVVKIMLHISKEYQLARFRRRLERPDKWWKFNPDDLKTREKWESYMECFEIALNRCSTDYAPWYVVPSETRWFRNLVVSQIILEQLEAINPQFPEPDFDPGKFPPKSLK